MAFGAADESDCGFFGEGCQQAMMAVAFADSGEPFFAGWSSGALDVGGGLLVVGLQGAARAAWAAPSDWAEGVGEPNDGATHAFYDRAASLPWLQPLGDWRDSGGE